MKKLTEDWKVKKNYLKNKSFYDSIDCDLSPESKQVNNRKSQLSLRKKQTIVKSSFLNVTKSPVVAVKDNASVSIRRSNRLREKSLSTKLVEKKVSNYNEGTSFTFSESFSIEMANEASKFEKASLPDNIIPITSPPWKTQQKLLQNADEVDSECQEIVDILDITKIKEKHCKEKEVFPLSSLSKLKRNQELETSIDKSKEKTSLDASTKITCLNVTKENSSDSKEVKPETFIENQKSLDSKNSSVSEDDCLDLAYWGLPSQVISAYQARNINTMFQWQYECLSMKNVLNGKNLVYSAPTSAGKTLVAEILMLKKVIESKKKAMMILPFVSVVREKVNYLKEMFQDGGVVVGGYMGAHRPPGGLKAVDIAICTIEKANNLINRLMEEKRLDELGILVVDELHMLGDNSRGYLLELLLTKLLYNCKKNDINIQIIGMSATLPNLNVLSFWLNAELYHTDFRPVPLHEMYKIGSVIYDSKTSQHIRVLGKNDITFSNDSDHTIYLAIETVASGNGVLIFCPSKNWCEALATNIAREIYNTGRPIEHKNPAYNCVGQKLREYINGAYLNDILLQLKNSPAGIDPVLKLTVPFGVAFHHAGLTLEERDIIEGAFKQGILKVLVATTTLSSGVNLPARRVLIRSPLFCGTVIDTLSYKQMVGRAGRKGIDDQGESILLCKESEKKSALQLVTSELQPVKSCLLKSGKDGLHASLKRAVIEVIASGAAVTHEEVIQYASCTLLFASLIHENSNGEQSDTNVEESLHKCLGYLLENDFIFKIEKKENDITTISYKPTQLGTAILASGFSPEDSLRILKELQLARRCFVLENDLHILYEVTPPYLSDQMGSINWMNFLSLWEQLPDDYRRVGELVGVQESFIGLGIQGKLKMNSAQAYHRLAVHQRFYAALALNDLIQEIPLAVVSEKYNCNKGILQSLQQTTSTFSGMLTVFCNRLGWYNLELLFSQFQKRVHFGIQQELCDLIQLSTLNAQRARVLYNAGYETISSLASADSEDLELVLCNSGAFESEKQLDGDIAEEAMKRREVKRIRITGKQGVNEREAALLIIKEAQDFIKHELGIKTITWKSSAERDQSEMIENIEKEDGKNTRNVTPRKTKCMSSQLTINASPPKLSQDLSADGGKSKRAKLNLSSKIETINTTTSLQKSDCRLDVDSLEVKKNLIKKHSKRNLYDKDLKEKSQNAVEENSRLNNLSSNIDQKKKKYKSVGESDFVGQYIQDKVCLDLKKDEKLASPIADSSRTVCDKNLEEDYEDLNNLSHITSNVSLHENAGRNLNCNIEANHSKISNCDEKHGLLPKIDDKNETYFCANDVNGLFDELERTVLDIKSEKSHGSILKENEIPCPNKNLTFSQILLSKSAEIEDVYFSQSFRSPDCLDENLLDNKPLLALNSSKIEKIQTEFTSKKARDIFDAIFMSPDCQDMSLQLSDNVAFDSSIPKAQTDALIYSLQPNIDKENLKILNKENIGSENVLLNNSKVSDNVINLKENYNLNYLKIDKLACQSTPKYDLNQGKHLENFSFSSCSLLENCKLDFSEYNLPETKAKSNSFHKSDSPAHERKSETSGDLFESEESLDADVFIKVERQKSPPKKLENCLADENNISSGSGEIFTFEKSFEKMLGNLCTENIGMPLENGKEDAKLSKDGFKQNLKCEAPQNEVSKSPHFSPNTVKEFFLENSGDIFEDSAEFIDEPVFNDPKKQLSFEYEDNSKIFQTWNPSPNKVLHKDEVILPKKNNMSNVNNDSFLANVSHFSSFSSNSSEKISPKFEHMKSPEIVPRHFLAPEQQKISIENRAKNEVLENNTFQNKINGLTSNLILEKSLPSFDEINFNVVNITDENFDNFLKLLKEIPDFGLSVACEKAECKNAINIGPPKLRAKNSSTSTEMILINDDVLVAGLSFCWSNTVYFLAFPTDPDDGTISNHLTAMEMKLKLLQHLFQSFTCKRIMIYDIKSYCKVLWSGCNITLSQNKNVSYLDISIAAWLLDPGDGQQTLQELVLNYWPDASHLIEGFDRGNGSLGLQHWSSVTGRQRSATEAYLSFHLIKILLKHLKDKKLFQSFVDVEMPSILTLAKMELNGLGFDLKLAMSYRKELQKKQDTLLKKAHQLAGHSFNIMSSKDLSRILYKEMKLNPTDANCSPMANKHLSLGIVTRSSAKKLPPELKTNKECLEKIMHLHPLPKTIMDWRKLSFAVSKVLMPLLRENRFDKDFQMRRLHSTCYVYTVTGRINMHTPNLQFIPRDFSIEDRMPGSWENEEYYQTDDDLSLYGVSLRNMFIPSEGNVLLSADYSQLELRILAHLSGDVKLLKSLNSGEDIFKQIAAVWINIPISAVTDDIRQQAKKICYGIIYGMSPKTLAHQLKTTENDAAHFMETFKKSYPGMTYYLNSILKRCRDKGYVTTIMERRRYLPHILSENKGERSQAERQAINTTIQGSAADIIKKAMIEIEKQLKDLYDKNTTPPVASKRDVKKVKKYYRGGFLVLQLHDELIYEVNKNDLEAVKHTVKTVMEGTTKLSVVLPVNIKIGCSWGLMKEAS